MAIDNPVENFHSIADRSVDVALGLAGLHHSRSHRATIAESFRVLKSGGQLAICDVPFGSSLADWLNVFVARHCPAGHDGNFPVAGDIARICQEVGFADAAEELRDVPWIFGGREEIAPFFKGLFGLDLEIGEIDRALDDYFTITEQPGGCSVEWRLAYAHARKPS